MNGRRIDRLNSLLKEVISEVIQRDVKNPHLPPLITVTGVEITKDLMHAKVYVSVIGDAAIKQKALSVLQTSAGFIATHASKKVVMRYFPALTFVIDDSLDKHMRIDSILTEIQKEREKRPKTEE